MKPNIFEISTKELTQDGFITWLLKWADPSNKQFNGYEKLNLCAMDFVKFLINTQYKEDLEITKVEAGRQKKNIDIWAKVNDKYFIIIEDKTYTGESPNQLERYKKTAMDLCEKDNLNLICIYLKTGTEAKSSLKKISEKGFATVNRSDLIGLLKKHDVKNDIYADFLEKLENLENAEKAFETKMIKDWVSDCSCWTGFYHYLDTQIDGAGWEWVNNPANGFLGFWWCFIPWKGYWVYLQIDKGNLCFKVGEIEDNKRSAIRDELHDIIIKQAQNENRAEIKKPKFGKGKNMTVAIVSRENWLGADGSVLDKEKVIGTLKEYQSFLNRCVKN